MSTPDTTKTNAPTQNGTPKPDTTQPPTLTLEFLPQYLRCYTEERSSPKKAGYAAQKRAEREAEKREARRNRTKMQVDLDSMGYHGKALIFDTETSITMDQTLKVGCYIICGLDTDEKIALSKSKLLTRELLDSKQESGLFYNPKNIDKKELAIITKFCESHNFKLYTTNEFVTKVFYPIVHDAEALCIGHNLKFDISRLATDWGEAKKAYKGGFTFKLCECNTPASQRLYCPDHPPVKVKTLGSGKALYEFGGVADFKKYNKGGKVERTKMSSPKFLDTMTIGKALLGAGVSGSLLNMGKKFKADIIKTDASEHGRITQKYLEYLVNDVEATFALYKKERELYLKHGLSREIWRIYSEASLGKAYLEEMEFPKFMEKHKEVPKDDIGYFMQTYYGGRAGVHYRHKLIESMYADFKSQYPSVNAIIDLQSVLLAEKIEIIDNTPEVKEFIDTITLEKLQNPETWKQLLTIVEVKPVDDILPIRTTFDETSTNIATPYISGGMPTWYTLADVIVSKLLTGKTPTITRVRTIKATGRVKTKPVKIFGQDDYTIDLSRDDFFTKVIDLRTDVKVNRDKCERGSDDYEFLDSLQNGLKLLANSTSYGVLVEVTPSEHEKEVSGVAYTDRPQTVRSNRLEKPGAYFCPFGAFITAGGRLLLGIAEKLAIDRGLIVAMTDTDSMIFGRSDALEREQFRYSVKEICDWFLPLSPYKNGGAFFELEDTNFLNGKIEPLYFAGVSSKRYALCNIESHPERKKQYKTDIRSLEEIQNEIVIRGFKEHGIVVDSPESYTSELSDTWGLEFQNHRNKWVGEAWYRHIYKLRFNVDAPVRGADDRASDMFINFPQRQRLSLSTWHLYEIYGAPHKKDRSIRPFNFCALYPRLPRGSKPLPVSQREDAKTTPTFYAPAVPINNDTDTLTVFRTDTNEQVIIEIDDMRKITDMLPKYFDHPEAKSTPSNGVGLLHRKDIQVIDHIFIGKEYDEKLGASGALKEDQHQLGYALGVFAMTETRNLFNGVPDWYRQQIADELGVTNGDVYRMMEGYQTAGDVGGPLYNKVKALADKYRRKEASGGPSRQSAKTTGAGQPATEDIRNEITRAENIKSLADLARQSGVSENTLQAAKQGQLVSINVAAKVREVVDLPIRFSIRNELREAGRFFTLKKIADAAKVAYKSVLRAWRGVAKY